MTDINAQAQPNCEHCNGTGHAVSSNANGDEYTMRCCCVPDLDAIRKAHKECPPNSIPGDGIYQSKYQRLYHEHVATLLSVVDAQAGELERAKSANGAMGYDLDHSQIANKELAAEIAALKAQCAGLVVALNSIIETVDLYLERDEERTPLWDVGETARAVLTGSTPLLKAHDAEVALETLDAIKKQYQIFQLSPRFTVDAVPTTTINAEIIRIRREGGKV